MSSDTGPVGDPALVKGDAASGSQNQRVAITKGGMPVAIYKAPVRELAQGMDLRTIANVTLTKCAITDYIPNNRQNTACEGTREYSYDPVIIETSFKLVGGGKSPDLSGPSLTIGKPLRYRCTTAIHHCSVSQEEEIAVGGGGLKVEDASRYKWVVFEATASSPKAKGCKPPTARGCNVLAVETQKGTAMYWVQADDDVAEATPPPADETAEVETLKVLPNKSNKNKVRRVVYSVELAPEDEVDELVGKQFELAGQGTDPRAPAAGSRHRLLHRAQRQPDGNQGAVPDQRQLRPLEDRKRRRQLRFALRGGGRRSGDHESCPVTSRRGVATSTSSRRPHGWRRSRGRPSRSSTAASSRSPMRSRLKPTPAPPPRATPANGNGHLTGPGERRKPSWPSRFRHAGASPRREADRLRHVHAGGCAPVCGLRQGVVRGPGHPDPAAHRSRPPDRDRRGRPAGCSADHPPRPHRRRPG